MAVSLAVLKRSKSGNGIDAQVQLTFSGTYPTGGEAVSFEAAVGITNRPPSNVMVAGKAGFLYQYDSLNKKVLVLCNTAGGANLRMDEHTAATYVAGVSGDVVVADVKWRAFPGLPA